MSFWKSLRKATAALRPAPVTDEAIRERVRTKLDRMASRAPSITVMVEHGCVELRGPIETRERARVVRAIAKLKGVDAVVDLMTEPEAGAGLISSRA